MKMKRYCTALLLPVLLLAACVAKDSPVQHPPFPLSDREGWNLAFNEALYQRATRDDFKKPPLALLSWARDPIPLRKKLVDPATGKVLREIEGIDGEWSLPARRAGYDYFRHYCAPVDVHSGAVLPWPFAISSGSDGCFRVSYSDRNTKEVWRTTLPWTESDVSDVDVSACEACVVVKLEEHLMALDWQDGRVLWVREGCAGEMSVGHRYVMCDALRDPLHEVTVVDAATGEKLFHQTIEAGERATVYFDLRCVVVATGSWITDEQSFVYEFGGRLLYTINGVLEEIAEHQGQRIFVTNNEISAMRAGRTLWSIPFQYPLFVFHADVTFPANGWALLHLYEGLTSGDGWTALIDVASGELLWVHETPRLVAAVEAYGRFSYIEQRGSLVYVINQESGGQTIEVLDLRTGKLQRIWAYDLERDREDQTE